MWHDFTRISAQRRIAEVADALKIQIQETNILLLDCSI